MRKPLLSDKRLSLLAITLSIATVLILGAAPVLAASTGDLDLTGVIAPACDVVVTPVGGVADALPFGAAQTDLNVASVNEACNVVAGFDMTAQSANSSVLTPVGASPDTVAYTFKYDTTLYDLSGGGAVNVTNSVIRTPPAGWDKAVDISYADPTGIGADTYTDTITFTITAK
jgi:hypothetical protein